MLDNMICLSLLIVSQEGNCSKHEENFLGKLNEGNRNKWIDHKSRMINRNEFPVSYQINS